MTIEMMTKKHGDFRWLKRDILDDVGDWDVEVNDLLSADLKSLMAMARNIRDTHWGRGVTYSRKAFVPLTNMCRDICSYCTFVKHPDDPEARIMTPDQVLETARKGEAQGCKELLSVWAKSRN